MSAKQEVRPILELAWSVVVSELGWMAMVIVNTMLVDRINVEAIARQKRKE